MSAKIILPPIESCPTIEISLKLAGPVTIIWSNLPNMLWKFVILASCPDREAVSIKSVTMSLASMEGFIFCNPENIGTSINKSSVLILAILSPELESF